MSVVDTVSKVDFDSSKIAELCALKLFEKASKGNVPPVGTYSVQGSLTIEINGELKKAPDTTYTPTADIPLLTTMAILLERAGITREASMDLIVSSATEALTQGENVSDEMQTFLKDAEKSLFELKRRLSKDLPKKSRKGATKVTGTMNIVSSQMSVHSS